MITLESAGITDVGKKRKGNEDSLLLDEDLRLYVVADGMGGHRAGEVASRLVVDTIRDCMKSYLEGCPVEEATDPAEGHSEAANRLLASIHRANREVKRTSDGNESYKGMGSTVSAVHVVDDLLIAANVGDSPIYLVRGGSIEEISVPHTVIAEQAALYPGVNPLLGEMFRHMLSRAMGSMETVQPDFREVPVVRGDIVVLCSDGLSNKVTPEEIFEIVGGETPRKACRRLVDLANRRGGEDNITVLVLKAKEKEEEIRQSLPGRILAKVLAGLRSVFPQ